VVAVEEEAVVVAASAASSTRGPLLEPGTYNVKLSVNGKDYTTKVVVEADPGMQP
jgi:hypothetical protein